MTPFRVLRRLALFAAVLLLCDALASEAWAGVGSFFSGMGARGRIVQLCVVVAGFSLLIILKKFSPDSRAFAPKMNYALEGEAPAEPCGHVPHGPSGPEVPPGSAGASPSNCPAPIRDGD